MLFYSLRCSGLSRYYLPSTLESFSQIALLRHIFKASSFTLSTRLLYYIYILCILTKRLFFAKLFLKKSSISNPILDGITDELPWCVYKNSDDKITLLILDSSYIKTIHASNNPLQKSNSLYSRLKELNIDISAYIPTRINLSPSQLDGWNISTFRNKIPFSYQSHCVSDLHIDVLGRLVNQHDSVDIIRLLYNYIARLEKLDLSNLERYRYQLRLLTQRSETLKVQSVASHGDFAPWNMYITFDKNLIVYDWEFFSYPSFPFFDLSYYFYVSTRCLNRHYSDRTKNNYYRKLNAYYKYPESEFLFLVELSKILASVEFKLRSISNSLIKSE